MESEFWIAKWNKQETGFHLGEPHAQLKEFHQQVFANLCNIFVPLCGKTVDLNFLAKHYQRILGNELSPIAVEQYFTEQNILPQQHQPQQHQQGSFAQLSHHNIAILIGNYFQLTPVMLEGIQGIYDRAALIALPKAMRENYVKQLRQIVPSGKLLLITLEYDQNEMQGPPFSVNKQEVETLFGFAQINQLGKNNILNREPKFIARGITQLFEVTYQIEW